MAAGASSFVTSGRERSASNPPSALVNAGGPWAERILRDQLGQAPPETVRLVRGSHIVTQRLFDHDRPYVFQQSDGRIVFAIPFEQDFTLIGTTDRDHDGAPGDACCTDDEADYLREAVSGYFRRPVAREDIVWRFSGVRPLFDDGSRSATAATRDYVLRLDCAEGGAAGGGAPLLNVYGGKITTYRRLAEAALARLAPFLPAGVLGPGRPARRCRAATSRPTGWRRRSRPWPSAIRSSAPTGRGA